MANRKTTLTLFLIVAVFLTKVYGQDEEEENFGELSGAIQRIHELRLHVDWANSAYPSFDMLEQLAVIEKYSNFGKAEAIMELGMSYLFGDRGSVDTAKASQYIFMEELDGVSEVYFLRALLYAFGFGVKSNQAQSYLQLYFGANARDERSLHTLGFFHHHGIHVPKHCGRALANYRQVGETAKNWLVSTGVINPEAGLMLDHEVELPQSQDEVLEFFKLVAHYGDATAQNFLGAVYLRGAYGVDQDMNLAEQNFRQAAENGLPQAYGRLGLMHVNQLVDNPNNTAAVEYFGKGIEAQDGESANGLGFMYLNGVGVEKNETRAAELFELAASWNSLDGHVSLGTCYFNGFGVKKNLAQAFDHFLYASNQGHPFGAFFLGLMYESGLGVLASCDSAVHYFKTTADLGQISDYSASGLNAYQHGLLEKALVMYAMGAMVGVPHSLNNFAFILEELIRQVSNADPHDHVYEHIFSQSTVSDLRELSLTYWRRSSLLHNPKALIKVADAAFQQARSAPENVDDTLETTDSIVVTLFGVAEKPRVPTKRALYGYARELYSRAGQLGNAQGTFNVGYMHLQGYGVPKDLTLAHNHFRLAMAQGSDGQLAGFLGMSYVELLQLTEGLIDLSDVLETVSHIDLQLILLVTTVLAFLILRQFF